jgi:hypothetical protein
MFEQKSPGEIHVVAVVGLFWEVGRLLAPTTCSIIAVQKRRDGGGGRKKDPKDGLRMAGRGRSYALLQASFTFSAAGVQPFKAIGVLSTNANGLRFPILSLIFYDLSSDTKTWKRSTHLLLKCTSFLPGLFVLSLLFDFLATGEDVCNIPEIVSNMGIPCGMPLRVDCSVMLSRVGCVSLSLVPFWFWFFSIWLEIIRYSSSHVYHIY